MSDANSPTGRSPRRDFLAQLGAAATTLAGSASVGALLAQPTPTSPWDMSWVDKLATAKYRVAFDAASTVEDNLGRDYAAGFLDQYHEVYGTSDAETRAVIVFRQLGTAIGLNDSIWERYPLGEHSKVNDPATKSRARHNPYWKARPGASADDASTMLETLMARGTIVLVCNVAAGNVGSALARATGKDVDEVRADVRRNLVPGAILVPTGVFALIRAQNAGCAFMRA